MTASKRSLAEDVHSKDVRPGEAPYESPQIVTLGTLAELTAGGHGSSHDGFGHHRHSGD